MDGRDVGLTPVQAWAGINGQKNAGRLGGVEEIRIMTNRGDVVWAR
jgi:hypothetical protein